MLGTATTTIRIEACDSAYGWVVAVHHGHGEREIVGDFYDTLDGAMEKARTEAQRRGSDCRIAVSNDAVILNLRRHG